MTQSEIVEKSENVETALQRQQCELDLNQFVDLLIHAAHAAWRSRELTPREASLYLRQSDILEAAVADLKKLLHHPDSTVWAKRMRTLHEALGSTAVIARHGLEDKATDRLHGRLRERLRTTRGRKKKAHNDQLRRETLTRLIAEARRKKENQGETDWGIAGIVAAEASKLPGLIGRESISQRTVYDWINPPKKSAKRRK
jgi:hypothetical protein